MKVRVHYEKEGYCCYCGNALTDGKFETVEHAPDYRIGLSPWKHAFCNRLEAIAFLQFEEMQEHFLVGYGGE